VEGAELNDFRMVRVQLVRMMWTLFQDRILYIDGQNGNT